MFLSRCQTTHLIAYPLSHNIDDPHYIIIVVIVIVQQLLQIYLLSDFLYFVILTYKHVTIIACLSVISLSLLSKKPICVYIYIYVYIIKIKQFKNEIIIYLIESISLAIFACKLLQILIN